MCEFKDKPFSHTVPSGLQLVSQANDMTINIFGLFLAFQHSYNSYLTRSITGLQSYSFTEVMLNVCKCFGLFSASVPQVYNLA